LPCSSRRSTPACAAILRASGDAFTRPTPVATRSGDTRAGAVADTRVGRAGGAGAGGGAAGGVTRGASGLDAEAGCLVAKSSLLGCGGTAAGRSEVAPAGGAGCADGTADAAAGADGATVGAGELATTGAMSSFGSAM